MILFVMARGRKKTAAPAMPEVLAAPASGPAGLPPASPSQAGALQGGDMPQFPALMPSRTEVLLKQLQDAGRNNPEAWAGVLRGWLSEEEAS
jgi:flagellar biosynthesis/type III secretory pathway M-ring protein FliF/YscJ